MNRRDFLKTTGAAAMTLALTGNRSSTERPNIIYIMMDEWGYFEWSGMGHPILQTPNIDRMASEGIRFTQMLAGGSVCAPTRNCLLTGQHSGHTAIRSNSGGSSLRPEDVTIGEVLKQADYVTGGFGKWGLGDAGTTGVPEKHGFDTFFGYYHQVHAHSYYPKYLLRNGKKETLKGNTGDLRTGKIFSHYLIHEEGLKFIRENKDKRFFAYLPWTPPHGLWGMPEDDPAWQKYKDKVWDAGNQGDKRDAQFYAAMVEMADRQIGEIFSLLKELNIDEKTIVFVCGDNGGQPYFNNEKHVHGFFGPNLNPRTNERFRGGKRNFYEGGLRIPFIVRWPGKIKPGTVSDHLGYFPDVMPTLAELAGVKPPNNTDGISFAPTLLGADKSDREQKEHKFLYWEDPGSCAVRVKNWKAIKPSNKENFELYNLADDIEEKNNIADQHPDIVKKIEEFARSAHQPQVSGTVIDASAGFKGHKSD